MWSVDAASVFHMLRWRHFQTNNKNNTHPIAVYLDWISRNSERGEIELDDGVHFYSIDTPGVGIAKFGIKQNVFHCWCAWFFSCSFNFN